MNSRQGRQERARDAAHYALSTLRAAAALLPDGPRALCAQVLRGLGPTPGTLEVDWSARPSPEHPRPAVLVHGTNDTSATWADAAAALREHGYAVFAPDYGHEQGSARGRAGGGGIGDIESSAREIAEYAREVLRVTGAPAVDLVGHSQGGLLVHLAAREADLPIDRLVTLGSTLRGAAPLGPLDPIAHSPLVATALDGFLGPSARQQIRGSALLTRLAAEPETRAGITYTSIASRFDRTVRPVSAQHLAPGPGVRNVWLDDRDHVAHAEMPGHPAVIALLRETLDG
ncbi:MAG: alpha/beta fold hydrolase [Dermatophilaceae bacterium]